MFCCFGGEKEELGPCRLKMVIVGDGDCGKTCLLHRFAYDQFYTHYIPTVFEVEAKTVYYKEREVNLVMYDTAGQEDYDRLRPFSYDDTDVVVICFSLDCPDSLTNVLLNWVPEIRYFCGDVPLLLVGNKKDLRHVSSPNKMAADLLDKTLSAEMSSAEMSSVIMSPLSSSSSEMAKLKKSAKNNVVTFDEGQAVASEMGAVGYFETSAKKGEGTDAVFEAVVRAGMEEIRCRRKKKKSKVGGKKR